MPLPISNNSIQSKGRLLSLSSPVVMGILNATPDSFYTKGRDNNVAGMLRTAEKMLNDGATILDIGGASTKPGQALMDSSEERNRVIPVMEALSREFPDAWLSVDTYNAKVAQEAVTAGAHIVNDVSSGRFDPTMIATVAALGVPYIAMHMQGTPADMQINPAYQNVTLEVISYLQNVCQQCAAAGIKDVIIDPGFGFGKTVAHNFELLTSLSDFSILGRPLLAGLSRKSMICKPLKVNPDEALNGTTALNMVALQQGARILRVHDVKEAREVITLWQYLNKIVLT